MISGVSNARRKKFGRTPNRSSIRFSRFGTSPSAAFGLCAVIVASIGQFTQDRIIPSSESNARRRTKEETADSQMYDGQASSGNCDRNLGEAASEDDGMICLVWK